MTPLAVGTNRPDRGDAALSPQVCAESLQALARDDDDEGLQLMSERFVGSKFHDLRIDAIVRIGKKNDR